MKNYCFSTQRSPTITEGVQNGLPFHPLRPEVTYAIHQWHHPQRFARSHSQLSTKHYLRSATASIGV